MPNFFDLFRAPEAKASRTAKVLAFESGGRARWTPRDYAALAREGYLANAIVHRAVRVIAENAASCQFLLYEGAMERDCHPLLQLLAKPNPRQDGASFFETLYSHMLLAGNAYVEGVALDDQVRELYALRPDRMKVVPGSDGWPEAYEYGVGGRSVRFDQIASRVPPILHLTFFHPLDDHYGLAPIEAAAVAVDAAIQIGVADMNRTAPPPTPAAGERHVVASGATGAWAGLAKAIATWEDGAWRFLVAKPGWLVWSAADNSVFVFDGASWSVVSGGGGGGSPTLDNLSHVGINSTAISPNLLSVHSNAALFNSINAADGGTGDARIQISKGNSANAASVVFSDSFSGRAEFGLTGDDNFHLKVSPDGSSWKEAMQFDRTSGRVSFPGGGARELLTANRTYYVRTDGSDSNTGLANTSGGAFLTIQKAIDTVANEVDLNGFNVTIQVATGTYIGNIAVNGPWVGWGTVVLQGDLTTPSNVFLNLSSVLTVGLGAIAGQAPVNIGAKLSIGGFKIACSGGSCIAANECSSVNIFGPMEYGTCSSNHLAAQRYGEIVVGADYKISGSAVSHWNATTNGAIICIGRTLTLSGSPVFSTAFANCMRQSRIICNGDTFSGSTGSTSKRFNLNTMGLIDTAGSNEASYLPGDTPGTNTGGLGLYV